jgi:hypothetical protein
MALVNPNIAMSYKPTTEYQPRNALAEYAQIQQIQGGQMQMAKLKRDEEALDTMMQTITAKGGPSDPMVAADAMIKSRNPNFMAAGLAIQQTHRDTQQTRAALGLPPLRGIATPNATPINALSPTPPTSGALGSGTFDPMAPAALVAPTNAMVPAAAPVAPTNAMTPAPAGGMSPEVMRAYEMLASPNPAVQKAGDMKLKELTESQVVAPGGTIVRGGKAVYTAPSAAGTPSALTRLMNEMDALPPGDPRRAIYQSQINKETTHAPQAQGATIKINTQLPASEEAQKEFMKESRQTFGALKQAPTVLSNIEAAKKLIPAAKGFMGPGGEPLLAAASFLNNRLGTNIDTKGVESAEELRSRLFFGILDNLKKLDSQPTKQQQDALRVALGSIGTDPTALPRVLDAFGNSIREKVDLYNQEVTGAEERGVKFPYKPTIALPSRPSGARPSSGNVVVTPDGRSHSFPTPEAAAQFKKAAGL